MTRQAVWWPRSVSSRGLDVVCRAWSLQPLLREALAKRHLPLTQPAHELLVEFLTKEELKGLLVVLNSHVQLQLVELSEPKLFVSSSSEEGSSRRRVPLTGVTPHRCG